MNELEMAIAGQMHDVVRGACDQVVHGDDIMPFRQQPITQMAAKETCAAGD